MCRDGVLVAVVKERLSCALDGLCHGRGFGCRHATSALMGHIRNLQQRAPPPYG